MKNKLHLITLTALAAAAFALPLQAADTTTAAPEQSTIKPASSPAAPVETKKEMKAHALPFKGQIESVDKDKKTITLGGKKGAGRTFVVPETAKLMKSEGDAAATWDDLKVGEKVRGSYLKVADDKLEISTLKVGEKTAADASAGASPKKEKKAKTDKAS